MALIQVCDICRVEVGNNVKTYVEMSIHEDTGFPLGSVSRITLCEDCFKKFVNKDFISQVQKTSNGDVDLSKVTQPQEKLDEDIDLSYIN